MNRENKLEHRDTYTPENYEEYLEVAQYFMDNGINIFVELPTLEEDRYDDYPHLMWDKDSWANDEPYLTAIASVGDGEKVLTKSEFLHKAGLKTLFNNGKHLIHEFI